MFFRHFHNLESSQFLNLLTKKSRTMASASASKGSSTFHSTHSNNYDKMASNSTFSIAKLALTDPLFTSFSITSSSYILDNACGTGIVASLIKSQYPDARILGTDLAPGMIETFQTKAEKEGWNNVETKILDSRNLEGVEDGVFSHVITNFGFMPGTEDKSGPQKIAKEIWRVMRQGGVAVVTTWAGRLLFYGFGMKVKIKSKEETDNE